MENMAVDFWRDRNVFVTGATGLLGTWLVQELILRKANVICLVRDWVPSSRFFQEPEMERATIVRGELEDYFVLLRTLNEYEIDTVFHIAAQAVVGTSSRSALSTFEANIRGTYHLLEACKNNSRLIKRIVVASSDKAYGSHETLPYTEETPLQGRFPYDVSKASADLLAQSYFHTYQVPLSITRCGNLFGGGDLNFNRLIPGTIRSVIRNEQPVIRSNGQYIRDYFYVRDAVEANLLLAEQVSNPGITGEAFNFGPERPLSVINVVDMVLKEMGRSDLIPIILNEKLHEITVQYLNCSKAKKLLDWTPKYTIEKGLQETIAWYKKYFI
jgi:CDP-glucose 4,6-dehydratase